MCYPNYYPSYGYPTYSYPSYGYCPCYTQYTGFHYPAYYYAAYPAYYYTPIYFGGVVYTAPSQPRGEYKYGNCITIC